jgi:hypothetical protein
MNNQKIARELLAVARDLTAAPESKFRVEVRRDSWGFSTFDVTARNSSDAKRKALNMASDHEFSEKDAEYDIVDVSKASSTSIW